MTGESNFIWYELMTNDTAAAADFYSAVVGWKTALIPHSTADGSDYTIFSIEEGAMGVGGMMALRSDMVASGARSAWMGYVYVDDVDAKAGEFQANGGKVHMPAIDIPRIGRFAVVADPHGALLYIFKPLPPEGEMPDMPQPGSPGTVGWNELYAGDGKEAFEFYSKMFGWTKSEGMDMGPMGTYQLFGCGGRDIGGIMTKMGHMPMPFWNFYFTVEALDPAIEAATARGATVVNGPMEVPGGAWVVSAVDPQGAFFSLTAAKR